MKVNLNHWFFKDSLEWTRVSGVWYCRNSLFVVKIGKGKTRREAFQKLQRAMNLDYDACRRWDRNTDDKFKSWGRHVKRIGKEAEKYTKKALRR
jgi:hypothetical protein